MPQSQSACGDKPTGNVVLLWHPEDPLADLTTRFDRDAWRIRGKTKFRLKGTCITGHQLQCLVNHY